jgi:spore germination cell wall hydrolase CwlJ-like protein
LAGGVLLLLALAIPLRAEIAGGAAGGVAALDATLSALLVQERSALSGLPETRLSELTRDPPMRKSRAGAAPDYDQDWLAQQPEASGDAQFECLVQAIYHEARGESLPGQAAVAEVVLNRVDDPDFPASICQVVQQSNARGCQFSYSCDGRSDRMRDAEAAARARKIARALIDGAPRKLTDGATYFHTRNVRPSWSRSFTITRQIGVHLFYRPPLRTAAN